MKCRHCGESVDSVFLDLGFAPPSNSYIPLNKLTESEVYYPLKVFVCKECWLVQTQDVVNKTDMFNESYAYLSSASTSWVEHSKKYCDMISNRLELSKQSLVVEIASNDGYLLRNFVQMGIPCIGIEPTAIAASISEASGIRTIVEFFGFDFAENFVSAEKEADLIIANNVYAHVPDINDFTQGLKKMLSPNGTITIEFPHLLNLIVESQFDTIYHEHYSYLSLLFVQKIMYAHGLKVIDVDVITTHGGSLRVYVAHVENERAPSQNVHKLLEMEVAAGLQSATPYESFQENTERIKNNFLRFLLNERVENRKVVAYGAAAKGNTLMNFAGLKSDLISAVFDASDAKQGKVMPGSHIPIFHPDDLASHNPDTVVILPWNIASEIAPLIREATRSKSNVKIVTVVPTIIEFS